MSAVELIVKAVPEVGAGVDMATLAELLTDVPQEPNVCQFVPSHIRIAPEVGGKLVKSIVPDEAAMVMTPVVL